MSRKLTQYKSKEGESVDYEILYYSRLFLVKLYQKEFFKDEKIKNKNLIIEEIIKFNEENHLNIEDEKQVCLYLETQKLLDSIVQDNKELVKINENNYQKLFDILLEQLDEIQIVKTIEKLKRRKDEYFSWKELKEKFLLDPSVKEILICFRTQTFQKINEKFIFDDDLNCYICQKNFKTQNEYSTHIEDHYKLNVFKYHNSKNKNRRNNRRRNNKIENIVNIDSKLAKKAFKISFIPSLIFSTLRFTITNILSPRKNLIVDKIIIVGENWIFYLMDEDVPFGISTNETRQFYIDSDCLDLGERYPIYIIYKYYDDNDCVNFDRVVEEFFFIKSDNYPLKVNENNDNNMKFSKIPDYFPTEKLEKLCENKSFTNTHLLQAEPFLREYFDANKLITPNNLSKIFKTFLEIEDVTKTQIHKSLTMENCKIKLYSYSSKSYEYEFDNLPDDINIKDILNPSDEICLIRNGTTIRIMGTIDKVLETYVFFTLRDCQENIEYHNVLYKILFFPNRINFILQYAALEVFSELESSHDLHSTLFPNTLIDATTTNSHLSLNWFSKSIRSNNEQMDAVKNILSGLHNSIPFIIFGPPGTGKTTTVVESILQLYTTNYNNRILVLVGSNAACDEIGVRLLKYLQNKNILLRLYSQSMEKRIDTINNDLKLTSNLATNHQYYPKKEILENYKIIIATLMVAGKLTHGGIQSTFFTHIFIDECGASTEPESLIGIIGLKSLKTKLILSGDPKQLGPVLENKQVQELGLGTSLLERLLNRDCYKINKNTGTYNKAIQSRLIKNYRTHPDILYLSNYLYYDNELEACASDEITKWALGWYKLPSKNFPIIFNAVRGETIKDKRSSSLYNRAEIDVVLRYIKEIMFFGVNDRKITENDIGVISPYKMQSNLLRKELNRRGWFKIETGSVETFQGKEKPIIIVSMVRSNTHGIGFLASKKRLNVTLTRAQALLIIIGNPFTLQMSKDWKTVIDYCQQHKALIEHQKRDLPSIFEKNYNLSILNDCFINLSI